MGVLLLYFLSVPILEELTLKVVSRRRGKIVYTSADWVNTYGTPYHFVRIEGGLEDFFRPYEDWCRRTFSSPERDT
ncbi:hypothetical protein DES53_11575 [Roseimicrobium gellanilyticum]|uniref:Uncharacterized protein n=1 Tax=Roseimicrobium gellanilyticum TaxID=748857 RepID=A0A366H4J6_9BACT|nr:hypothetical protein [Roseimicrobium gellanilyticum]RBP36934.1 hypothetical protein DES53_11575 [Roseimicrobium gellanilyticum]